MVPAVPPPVTAPKNLSKGKKGNASETNLEYKQLLAIFFYHLGSTLSTISSSSSHSLTVNVHSKQQVTDREFLRCQEEIRFALLKKRR